MDITEIKRRVDLLKKVSQQRTVLIKDVAKELKEQQTNLMQFILDNPKLFLTEQVWSYKKEPYFEMYPWGKRRNFRDVRDKCKGLGITEVYLTPEENFRTDESVEHKKKEFGKTVWVSEWNNYGVIEGHYVKPDEDDPKDEHRYHLWRNTEKKIKELQKLGILTEGIFYIGGAFDCGTHRRDTVITAGGAERARSLGWTIIGI